MALPPNYGESRLLRALRSDETELVMASIAEDENLVHIPMRTCNGCDPPIIVALKEGCSTSTLQCLLRAGASVHDVDMAGLTSLEVVAGAWQDGSVTASGFGTQDFMSLWAPLVPPDGFLLPSPALDTVEEDSDEDRRCASAQLLLACGAPPASAARVAEARGFGRLAGLIRNWRDIVELGRLGGMRPRSGGRGLLGLPEELWELVCEALVPRKAELMSRRQGSSGGRGARVEPLQFSA